MRTLEFESLGFCRARNPTSGAPGRGRVKVISDLHLPQACCSHGWCPTGFSKPHRAGRQLLRHGGRKCTRRNYGPGGSYQIVNVVSIVATTRATQAPGGWMVPPAPRTRCINLGDLGAHDALQRDAPSMTDARGL